MLVRAMSKKTKLVSLGFLAAGVLVGAGAAYCVVRKPETIQKVKSVAQQMFAGTKSNFDSLSEEVALRTAKMTNNPKVNQDWVSNQWESIGY